VNNAAFKQKQQEKKPEQSSGCKSGLQCKGVTLGLE